MSHSESHVINNLEVHAQNEQSHGSVKDYLIGFVLSVVLTAIPFWAVMSGRFLNDHCMVHREHGDCANLGAFEIFLTPKLQN